MQQSQRISLGKEVIPGYKFLGLLGKGSMGNVYKATQLSMERTVAIKILSQDLASREEYVDRFFTEAKSVAKLNHPNIISGIDVGEHQGMYYFVMEYVEGTNLHKTIIQEGALPFEKVLPILQQILQAMGHAYKNNIVHRDIKPDNIMMTTEGIAKLCDLGLAKQATLGVKGKNKKTVGTPHYISPEQAMGMENIDIRADIYSLGASAFHLLTGQPPFNEGGPLELMRMHLNAPFPAITDFRQDVPKKFLKILDKMVEKDRDLRYQTPQELLEDIEGLKDSSPRPSSRRVPAALSEQILAGEAVNPWIKPTAWGLVGLLLVALTMYLAGGPPKKDPSNPSANNPFARGSGSGTSGSATSQASGSGSSKGSSTGSGTGTTGTGTTNSSYEAALRYQQKARDAYEKVRQFLILNNSDPQKCLTELEKFVQEYPRASFLSRAQTMIVYYKERIRIASLPKTDPDKKREEKLLAQIDTQMANLIAKKRYDLVFERLKIFFQSYPTLGQLKDRVPEYEKKMLASMEKDHRELLARKPLPLKELNRYQAFLEKLKPLGSPLFQKDLQSKLDDVLRLKALMDLQAQKDAVLVSIRAWHFSEAGKTLGALLQDPKYQKVLPQIAALQEIMNQVKKGQEWLVSTLNNLEKRKTKIEFTDSDREFVRIQEWDPSSDKIILRWYGKKKNNKETFSLRDFIPSLRRWLLASPLKKEFKAFGLFLLYSGDLEGAGQIMDSQYTSLIEEEKKNLATVAPLVLLSRARRYLENKAYGEAREVLLQHRRDNKNTPSFRKNLKEHVDFFQKVVKTYYKEKRIHGLVRGKISTPKKNFYQIYYDFSDEDLELWRDWEPTKRGGFSDNPEVKGSKNSMLVKGLAEYPLHFDGEVEVKVQAWLTPTKRTPANLCVFLGDKGPKKTMWFLGVWFKIPGVNQIFMGRNRKGDIWWRAFPANGIVHHKPGGPRQSKSLYIHYQPRISSTRKYRATFYHVGKIIGVKLNGSTLMSRTENYPEDRKGGIGLYTGNTTIRFYQIRVRGKVDPAWLDQKIDRVIQQEVQDYRNLKK